MKTIIAHQKHLVKDRLPKKKIIFCDTSFFVATILVDRTTRHKRCRKFVNRLLNERVAIVFSSLIYSEFWGALLKNAFRPIFGDDPRNIGELIREAEPDLLKWIVEDIRKDFQLLFELLNKFSGRTIAVHPDQDIINQALDLQKQYRLNTNDAIHTSTMLYGGKADLISFDKKDMGKIEGINLWCKYE